MALGRFLLRVLVGLLFVGHGTQKLLGWFGGGGLEATGDMFESIGLRPGRQNAAAAGVAEAGGGALLALGLATPLAAASLIAVQLTAIRTVHAKNGVWSGDGGFEYNAVLVAALTLLAEAGPGRPSLDAALGGEKRGVRWGTAALVGGALGSAATLKLAEARSRGSEDLSERLSAEATAPTAGTGRD
jgi:putative oxidoreductase